MELTNKRIQYTISNSNDTVKISGELTLGTDNLITSFSGNVTKVDGENVGDFYYNEISDTYCNKSVNNMVAEYADSACSLLTSTVASFKESLAKSE